MDTGIHKIIAYVKADDIYKSIPKDNKTRLDTSNYELDIDRPLDDRPLPKGKK